MDSGVMQELKESIECRCRPDLDDIDCQNIVQSFNRLRQQLAESQAREVKYRDALENYKILCQDENYYSHYVGVLKALAIPHDDTALKEYRDAVIEKCAKVCENSDRYRGDYFAIKVRELKNKE